MSASPALLTVQRWFQQAVCSGLPLQEFAPQQVIFPQGAELARLDIYARAYVLRLQECLEADYPLTAALMGQELFRFFASRYIRQRPSASPSLYDFGEAYADFLQQSQPENLVTGHPELAFPIALARLERGLHRVMRAPGLEPHSAAAAASQTGSDAQWQALSGGLAEHMYTALLSDSCMWQTAPCLQLMESPFPLRAYWLAARQAAADGDAATVPAIPAAAASFLALSRLHYRVQVTELERWQYAYLQALSGAQPVDIAALAAQCQCGQAELEADIALLAQ